MHNQPTPCPSMPTILERHSSGLALILWETGDVDVLTIDQAREAMETMQAALCACEQRGMM